jgi:hypothetical protein
MEMVPSSSSYQIATHTTQGDPQRVPEELTVLQRTHLTEHLLASQHLTHHWRTRDHNHQYLLLLIL